MKMIDPKPQLRAAVAHRVTYADNAPVLQLRWSPTPRAGEDPRRQVVGATYTIGHNTGADSKLRITLKELVRNESGGTSGVSDTTKNFDGNVYGTLAGLVKAINEDSMGFQARVLHAPSDFSVDSNTWTAETETALDAGGTEWKSCLKRSVVTTNPVYLRVGNPEVSDNGRFMLLRLQTKVTNATGAAGALYEDPVGGTKKTLRGDIVAGTTWTSHVSSAMDNAEIVRGPLLVQAGATNSTGLEIILTTVNAEA
jgi:hypothetical protein